MPLRHLTAIEGGEYGGLPSQTYATGFARAYARAIGADEVAITRQLRGDAFYFALIRTNHRVHLRLGGG